MKRIVVGLLVITCLAINGESDETKKMATSISERLASATPTPLKLAYKKPWTIFICMAARNDLYVFSHINLKQMCDIGSNENLNIVVQLYEPNKKGVQYIYIEKHNPILVFKDDQTLDSGNPQNLVNFVKWGVENFPAENYALFFWDHGTGGSIDPYIARVNNASELFIQQAEIEHVSRTLSFAGITDSPEQPEQVKGVCFDDTYRSYLTNQSLVTALSRIYKEVLQGKKLGLIAFDACLMGDIATASITKEFAEFQVSSEDVEPGSGYNYRLVLLPFQEQDLDPASFAHQIVTSYAQAYGKTGDYTQAAIDLSYVDKLEKNVHEVSLLLITCLSKQQGRTVKDAIHISCSKRLCTYFDEPYYKDLGHLYSNLLQNISLFQFRQPADDVLKEQLRALLEEGRSLIKKAIIANYTGKNINLASGISIYLPDTRVHSSFQKTTFASSNAWYTFIRQFLTV